MNSTTTEPESPGRIIKSLCIRIGDVAYAVPVSDVKEIVGFQLVTPVPGAPHWMLGVVNLRGGIVAVADARLRFGIEAREMNARSCIVILHVDGRTVGLVVDAVEDVQDLNITNKKVDLDHDVEGFISGMAAVGKSIRVLLDCRAIVGRSTT